MFFSQNMLPESIVSTPLGKIKKSKDMNQYTTV